MRTFCVLPVLSFIAYSKVVRLYDNTGRIMSEKKDICYFYFALILIFHGNNFLTTKVAEGLDAMQHSRVLLFLYYALIHPYGYIDEFLQIF